MVAQFWHTAGLGEVLQVGQGERDRERVLDLDGVVAAEHQRCSVASQVIGQAQDLDLRFGVEVDDPILGNTKPARTR
jgi:hypothetical protein